METGQVQSNVAPKQVAAAPAGAPAQPAAAVTGKPGEVPKKKGGLMKWILIIVLVLVVIGLLTFVFTSIF